MSAYIPLTLLLLVPAAVYLLAKNLGSHYIWTLTGASWGAVVMPATVGAHSLFYLGAMKPGFHLLLWPFVAACQLMEKLHNPIPFSLALRAGLIDTAKFVSGSEYFHLVLLQGGIWGLIYGVAGWIVDRRVQRGLSR